MCGPFSVSTRARVNIHTHTEMLLSRDPSNFPELTTSDHEIDYFNCVVVVVVAVVILCDQHSVTDENDQDFFSVRR